MAKRRGAEFCKREARPLEMLPASCSVLERNRVETQTVATLAEPSEGSTAGAEGSSSARSGSSESIWLFRQVGSISRVSRNQAAGSRPLSFEVASKRRIAAACFPACSDPTTPSFSCYRKFPITRNSSARSWKEASDAPQRGAHPCDNLSPFGRTGTRYDRFNDTLWNLP